MEIVLEIVNQPGNEAEVQRMIFSEEGGTIGRNKKSTWCLPDPSRYLSNFHVKISYDDGHFYVTDISSNGTFISPPKKRLSKGTPTILQKDNILSLGNYEILVKEIKMIPDKEVFNIEDKFNTNEIADENFIDKLNKDVSDIITSPLSEDDIVSVATGSFPEEEIASLNDIDEILSSINMDEYEEGDTLAVHIDQPNFVEEGEKNNQTVIDKSETSFIKILSYKLGIDFENMSNKEKEKFAQDLSEFILITLNSLNSTIKSIEKIKKQLEIIQSSNAKVDNFFNFAEKTSMSDSITQSLLSRITPLPQLAKEAFKEIDLHNAALAGAAKKTIFNTESKYSPYKLQMKFEKENLFNKKFTNKKAIAWENYCKMFEHLDSIDENDLDYSELKKEYLKLLDTLKIGYNL